METELIKKLVEIKSLSVDSIQCFRALEIIKTEIRKHRIPVSIRFNKGSPFLIAGETNKASILFLSHVDVVPGKDCQHKLVRKGNKLFGRGILDMKGPLVASLDAFVRLWEKEKNKIVFIVTSDEEIGGFNGASFLVKKIPENIRLAIVPDGDGEDLIIIQKAPFHIKILAKGKMAHGSKPWKAKNAAMNLMECCTELERKFGTNSPKSTTLALCQFHSGNTINMIPDRAEAVFDVRIKKESEVKKIVNGICTITKKHNCSWKQIDEALFFEIKRKNVFVKKWIRAFKEVHNKNIKLVISSGTSDARFLWRELKIPVIVTSVKGGGAHSDNEWVDINSLENLSKTIVKFINSL